ncbi:MAG: murein biosynthesis integral membrane protein MurJ [Epsilonproteobacteria bacterium]|nr:murein biosynthesis integral membrane protein MurJ [Campylobacterota bacterium]NPA57651.1 murein biosynthesis integral membrane protein MurJ [Campylobacterota bacterium]
MIGKIFTNSVGILLSRILGFFRDLLTAQILGANIYSDIFFVAFKLPNLFRRIFGEGAFVQSFLPSFARARKKFLFGTAVALILFGVILLLSLAVTLWSPLFTKLIAFGFSQELVERAAPLVALNFYYLDLIFLVTFIAALLQYREHFATTAFSTALLNISLITALLLSQGREGEEIVWAMGLGVIVGGVLQLLAHLVAASKKGLLAPLIAALIRLPRRWKVVQGDLRHFFKNFFPAIWGNSTAQVSAFLDTWLASFLPAGSISYLYYGNRVFQLPLALFAIATATALFPSVAKALNSGREEEALREIRRSFWLLATLLTLSFVGGVLLAREIVWLLFERGSFGRSDTEATALVLQMYLLGLLFYGVGKLFSLWLYARHNQERAARIATISLTVNVLLSLILIVPLGAAGLALASSLAGGVQFLLLVASFGWERFLALLKDRFAIYLLTALALEVVVILMIKGFIDAPI